MKDSPPPISVAWCVAVLLTHFLATAALLAVLLTVVPGYEAMFKDFGVKLPVLTERTISASRWVAHWWFLVLFPLGIDAGVLFSLRHLPPQKRWIARAWAVLVLVAAALLILLSLAGVMLAYRDLIQNLSR